jgi:hypothetical protein
MGPALASVIPVLPKQRPELFVPQEHHVVQQVASGAAHEPVVRHNWIRRQGVTITRPAQLPGRVSFAKHYHADSKQWRLYLLDVDQGTIDLLSPTAARMEQSFSDDGGKTWEVNWICELSRFPFMGGGSDDPTRTRSGADLSPWCVHWSQVGAG